MNQIGGDEVITTLPKPNEGEPDAVPCSSGVEQKNGWRLLVSKLVNGQWLWHWFLHYALLAFLLLWHYFPRIMRHFCLSSIVDSADYSISLGNIIVRGNYSHLL
jgi:hypothetical protein